MNILLTGPYPPPYGGIAVYIQRLEGCLIRKNIDVQILSFEDSQTAGIVKESESLVRASGKAYLDKIFSIKSDIIHDNFGIYIWTHFAGQLYYALRLLFTKKPVILTIHQGKYPEVYHRLNFLRKRLTRFLLKKMAFIICDNAEILSLILSLGIEKSKAQVLSPFVPFEDTSDDSLLSEDVQTFFRERSPNLIVTGYSYSRVYNFEHAIKAAEMLRKRFPKIGLVLVVSSYVNEPEYKEEILTLIQTCDMQDNVLFISDIPNVFPVYRKSDLFIRATSSDGDSLSVREALYLGVPVLASDCSVRPKGTILFKTGDINDLYEKISSLLDEGILHKDFNRWIKDEAEQNLNALLKIYERVWNRTNTSA